MIDNDPDYEDYLEYRYNAIINDPCPDRCMRCDEILFDDCYEFFVDTELITANLIVCSSCLDALVEENPNGDNNRE